MLIGGLRAEFPGLFSFAERTRIPIRSSSPPWAALAGIGASFLVGGIVRELLTPLFLSPEAMRWLGPRLFEIAAIAGAAAGLTVSLRAGGPRGAALYVAYAVASLLLSLVRVLSGLIECGPSSMPCELFDPWRPILASWTTALGILLGIPLAAMLRSVRAGANMLLEAAGAFSLGNFVVFAAVGLVLTLANARSSGPELGTSMFVLSMFVPAISAGYVLATRGPRAFRSALLFAALVVVGWGSLGLGQVRQAISAGMGPLELAFLASPIISAALAVPALLVWRRTLAALR